MEVVLRLAHRIIGVSGNMAANDILGVARRLESAIKNKEEDKYPDLLAELDASLQTFVALTSTLNEMIEPEAAGNMKPVDSAEVEPILQKLAHLVWQDNVGSGQVLENLRKAIGASAFRDEMNELGKGIHDFDFDAARIPLLKIAEGMQVVLDASTGKP
jgi:HPt (histidine-containing phosphotransfer) domain-containing protein